MAGLIPRKPGPHGGHKLTPAMLQFVTEAHTTDPSVRAERLAQWVRQRFGVRVLRASSSDSSCTNEKCFVRRICGRVAAPELVQDMIEKQAPALFLQHRLVALARHAACLAGAYLVQAPG